MFKHPVFVLSVDTACSATLFRSSTIRICVSSCFHCHIYVLIYSLKKTSGCLVERDARREGGWPDGR